MRYGSLSYPDKTLFALSAWPYADTGQRWPGGANVDHQPGRCVSRRDAVRARLTAIGATGACPAVAKEIAHEH